MTIQILTRSAMICNFLVGPEPIRASSRDYGFDFDKIELGEELLASLPLSLSTSSTPEVAAEEFESRFLSFIS